MTRKPIDTEAILDAVQRDDGTGFCVACGEEAMGVGPDAAGYECETCGKPAVYGAEQLLVIRDTRGDTLATVREARKRRAGANHDYRAAIIRARAAGATLQAIADAAGSNPSAVQRLIRRNQPN